jgi:outer membrane protein
VGFGTLVLLLLAAAPALSQEARLAVIDSDRIVAESIKGQEALAKLSQMRDERIEAARGMQQEIADLRKRLEDGRLSLSEEKQSELQKELEDKAIALRRFQDDAEREMEKSQAEELKAIERQVLEIIGQIGREQQYTLIFNKFRSGLVFAADTVDITDVILQRFNVVTAQPAAEGE